MLDLSLQILSIMAPSIILASIGLAWKKSGTDYPTAFVTTLTLNIGLPALVFYTMVTADISLASLKTLGFATVAVHVVFLSVVIVVFKMVGKALPISIAHVVGNTGNLGLPLCLLAFGDEGLAYAMTFFAVQCLLFFTIGESVYAGAINVSRMLRVPVIYALLLAVVVRLSGIPLHSIILDTTEILGQLVVPIMLITLGVSIAGMKATNLSSTIGWSVVRTVMAFGVGVFIANLFGLTGVARGVLIIETVVPVAVFNYLLAHRYDRNSDEVSGMILVTHIGALFYLPLVLAYVL